LTVHARSGNYEAALHGSESDRQEALVSGAMMLLAVGTAYYVVMVALLIGLIILWRVLKARGIG
jgi:hypothetical protein